MTASPDDRTAQVDQTETAQEKTSAKRAPAKKQSPDAASAAEKSARPPAVKKPAAKTPAAKKPAVKKPASASTSAGSKAGSAAVSKSSAGKSSAATSGTQAAAEKAAPSADVVVEPLVKAVNGSTANLSSTASSARSTAAARNADAKATAAKTTAAKTTAARTTAAKTTAAKTTAAKTAAAKTAAAKTTAAKTAAAKTTAAKTTAAKTTAAKAAASKAAAAKTTARSAAAKTTAAKATAAKMAAAKKAAAKKAAEEAKAAAETAVTAPEVPPVAAAPLAASPVIETEPVVETVPPAASAAAPTGSVAEPVPAAEPAPAPASVPPLAAEPVEESVSAELLETETPVGDPSEVESSDSIQAVGESDDAASDAVEPGEVLSAGEAISIRGLVKQFGDNRAVDGIDLTVPAGSFYGIVGPNGAGKTTTLSIVAGLLRADAGSVVICGVDQAKKPLAAKRLMGVLPDRLRTFDRLTGRQLLYYYGLLRGLAADVIEKRAADLARAFDLGDALGRVVSDYSAGMTKKIMLAGAMIHSPRVLVLDEPFESVDPVSSAVILDILRAYVSHGGTVILSSHGMDLVERVCSRVAIIVGGEVLAEGTIDEVRAGQTLEARFVELAGTSGEVEGLEWLHTFSD
ncbi:ABC transporter ATP-binding protein [Microbacterium sp. K27]|uniref:ABC transporter ATP-binding protein n=1 Tax=Microbacterium sp. K27 TaxID=2305445 RepID=UPI001F10BBD0|nr:ATP-binding cassette domain-containing protein [Microbacterium sp. K27]